MEHNIIIMGFGGQGVILLTKIIGDLAIEKGNNVKISQKKGMAQRGGNVVSHIRIGKDIFSPIIPENSCELMICLESSQILNQIKYLKKNGFIVIVNDNSKDSSEVLDKKVLEDKNVFFIDKEEVIKYFNMDKVLNVVCLGVVLKYKLLDNSFNDVKEYICNNMKKESIELNINALKYGYSLRGGKNG